MSRLFAGIQKHLQNDELFLKACRVCSQLFAWVGVLLVYCWCTSGVFGVNRDQPSRVCASNDYYSFPEGALDFPGVNVGVSVRCTGPWPSHR